MRSMRSIGCSMLLLLAACEIETAADANATARSNGGEASARAAVLARLDSYTAAARAVDPDASASFFSSQGVLFEPGIPPIVSPDSIRAFIKSFPGVIVDSATAIADTVEVHGDMVLVWGTYFEALRFPGQPPSAQHGRFVMQWRREGDGAWRIARYYRIPLPAGSLP